VLGVGHDLGPAAVSHDAPGLVLVADRQLIKAFGHPGVGALAAAFHRVVEFGNAGDPVADGPRCHAEEFRQLGLGRAQPAVVAGERAVFGFEGGRTAIGAHGAKITTEVNKSMTNYASY
jgi:hypothetical protein